MSTYAIDSAAQSLRATGVVEPLYTWVENAATGRREQSSTQDTDETGTPLWGVEVTYISETWGRQSTVVAKVTTAAPQQPVLPAFEPVPFVGLTCTTSVVKSSGTLRESWRAQGIAQPAKRGE